MDNESWKSNSNKAGGYSIHNINLEKPKLRNQQTEYQYHNQPNWSKTLGRNIFHPVFIHFILPLLRIKSTWWTDRFFVFFMYYS